MYSRPQERGAAAAAGCIERLCSLRSGGESSAFLCYYLPDGIPKCKRVQAPSAPGFKPPSGCALGYGQAVRCSLNGQAMLAYEPDLRFLCRNRTSSARNRLRLPGWFKGKCCMLPLAAYKIFIAAGTAAIHNPRA